MQGFVVSIQGGGLYFYLEEIALYLSLKYLILFGS